MRPCRLMSATSVTCLGFDCQGHANKASIVTMRKQVRVDARRGEATQARRGELDILHVVVLQPRTVFVVMLHSFAIYGTTPFITDHTHHWPNCRHTSYDVASSSCVVFVSHPASLSSPSNGNITVSIAA